MSIYERGRKLALKAGKARSSSLVRPSVSFTEISVFGSVKVDILAILLATVCGWMCLVRS